MSAYKRTDEWGETWHYRKRITLPDGSKTRIAGTPAINSEDHALQAERDHVEREIKQARAAFIEPPGKKRGERILGPYEQGAKGWRVIEIDEDSKRSTIMFKTEQEAEIYIEKAREELGFSGDTSKREKATGSVYRRGKRWHAYARQDGKQVYVGAFDSESEARLGIKKSKCPIGEPVRLRVTAVFRNGAERELREIQLTIDGLSGFETDDSEYIVFLHRADRSGTPLGDTANDLIPEGVPF